MEHRPRRPRQRAARSRLQICNRALTVFLGSQIHELTAARLSEGPPRWVVGASIGLTLVAIVVIAGVAKRAVERVANAGEARKAE